MIKVSDTLNFRLRGYYLVELVELVNCPKLCINMNAYLEFESVA